MKKIKLCFLTIIIMFISLSSINAVSDLSIFDLGYSENIYKFSEDKDINLPFIRVSGERMEIDKDINKSGFSFARNISVLNRLTGIQILSSSDSVRVTGNLEYGVIMAPTVIIDGTIDKSVLIISKNITISKDAIIKEDLLCSTSNIQVIGNVEGSILGTIGKIDVLGNISQDLRANINEITLGENSNINGNIYLISTNENINISAKYPNATINIIEESNGIDIWNIIRTSLIFALIYLLLSNKTSYIKNGLNKVISYWKTTAIFGFGSILLFPLIVIAIIFLSVIGLGIVTVPFSIVYGGFMFIAFILSTFIVGSIMCEYISEKYNDKIKGIWDKLILAFCIMLVLNLVTFIPIIGYTLSVAICILSVGVLFTSLFKKIKE
ncbi:MAG: hypothetical protein K0R72_1322 [Clostridia bacterium]|nr:hypothetical protein [Clostridia bacterium]